MKLTLYKPKLEDLWFRKKMLEDEETMSYNHAWGGTVPFPVDDWEDWYDRWVVNHDNKRYYRYVKDGDTFVGEIAYHFDEKYQGYVANIIIFAKFRRKGYGKEALYIEDFLSHLEKGFIVKKEPDMECVEVHWEEPLTPTVNLHHSAYTLKKVPQGRKK